jgi:nucleotide-binding universal stress UspA family protein
VTRTAPGKEILMKILVGYNGSAVAKSALSQAKRYAKMCDAFVHVVISLEGGAGEKIEEISQAAKNLKYAEDYLKRDGIQCKTEQLVRGLAPGEDLVKFAEENEIDHLFVGIQKKSKTRKMLLGSTAQYVILKAPCPVTSVK